jgi:hypothetical protein
MLSSRQAQEISAIVDRLETLVTWVENLLREGHSPTRDARTMHHRMTLIRRELASQAMSLTESEISVWLRHRGRAADSDPLAVDPARDRWQASPAPPR